MPDDESGETEERSREDERKESADQSGSETSITSNLASNFILLDDNVFVRVKIYGDA